jgi:hypothetical protein
MSKTLELAYQLALDIHCKLNYYGCMEVELVDSQNLAEFEWIVVYKHQSRKLYVRLDTEQLFEEKTWKITVNELTLKFLQQLEQNQKLFNCRVGLLERDYTVVGGPAHGISISRNNGQKPVHISIDGRPILHIAYNFAYGKGDKTITVFASPYLPIRPIHLFLKGLYSDEVMLRFCPFKKQFIGDVEEYEDGE